MELFRKNDSPVSQGTFSNRLLPLLRLIRPCSRPRCLTMLKSFLAFQVIAAPANTYTKAVYDFLSFSTPFSVLERHFLIYQISNHNCRCSLNIRRHVSRLSNGYDSKHFLRTKDLGV